MQKKLINDVIELTRLAGQAILNIYQQCNFDVALKADASPLTQADLAAHSIIFAGLNALTPELPVVSEEGESIPWAQRKTYRRYWLVDPLDGTKEFVSRNGEFTVNIALIEEGQAQFGVVYSPVKKLLYWGAHSLGAFKQTDEGDCHTIQVATAPAPSASWRILGSRSHHNAEFDQFIQQFPQKQILTMGSSLKFCLIAEGLADLYPRFGLTCEWDTAAAQAVVEAAGGQVIDWQSRQPLRYNTKESLLNPPFIVCSQPSPLWFSSQPQARPKL